MRVYCRLILSLGLIWGASANASVIGDLSYDGSLITDLNTGRMYSNLADLKLLDYAQTLAELGAGGSYEGYSIADTKVADEFIDAMGCELF